MTNLDDASEPRSVVALLSPVAYSLALPWAWAARCDRVQRVAVASDVNLQGHVLRGSSVAGDAARCWQCRALGGASI